MTYFIGVDVGSGSARAGLFDDEGNLIDSAVEAITTWNPSKDHYEQSSDEIWEKVVFLIKKITEKSPVEGEHQDEFKRRIKGIGFAATCSLVCLDVDGKPVTISQTGKDNQNIIMWMDHRASEEATSINETKHEVLKYVGGKVSLEMEIPKILWLKNHMKGSFDRIKHFMDLADYLTWKCTNDFARSLCTVVCKWNFMGHIFAKEKLSGWDDSYFTQIGLDEFVEEGYARLGGNKICDIGERVGKGLTEAVADLMNLPHSRISVAVSLIDAHAGGLGVLGTVVPGDEHSEITESVLQKRLAIISGTSTCHMAISVNPVFCPGVWGPYYSALKPGMWLSEGGQADLMNLPHSRISVAVSLIDAHAGGLGVLGTVVPGDEHSEITESVLQKRLAIISGTSTCHMAISVNPVFCPGVWGPYYSALKPGMWLSEGGQSATGCLVDHIIKSHPALPTLEEEAKKVGVDTHEILLRRLEAMASKRGIPVDYLSKEFHILPYYYGNRSPRADPTLVGMISGLHLTKSLDDLALQYLAVLQAIAYGTKHIIDELNRNGYQIDTLFMTGGASKSQFLVQQHANITGCRVGVRTESAVLSGAAIIAASASKLFDDMNECMSRLTKFERMVQPQEQVAKYHKAKYNVFLRMYEDQMNYRKMMEEST
eukprot:TRINITY_DN2600_c0_g1_i2.p1 TRINITY_DN2600_c0_g1~~TRINITY_DN2600_c0_g1_i2.p1  ORF type:complete len:704 (+),score=229.53 TRINITY_DN2600_c0_g1_i2:149-2113(+)